MILPDKNYSLGGFKSDLLTAMIIAVVLIPQSLAYAFLAGLDPIYGLYGSIIPLLIYPLIGSSFFLSVGPVAIIALLVLAAASGFAECGTDAYLNVVLLLALLSGVFQVLFSVFKLGALSNYLAKPVLNGFVSAAAIIIIFSQVPNLTSVKVPRSSDFISISTNAMRTFSDPNWHSVLIGALGILLIVAFKKWIKSVPGALVVVVLGIAAVMLFRLEAKGVPIIGALPSGLPYFKADFIDLSIIKELIPSSFIIALICFISSYSIAKSFEDLQEHRINANRELMGLGIAKIVGSFFLTMPSSSSFSRSAINADNRIASGVSSFLVAIIIALTLLFFGKVFYYLPYPILGAIIISSVFSLIKFDYARLLWKYDKRDFAVCVLTFLFTLSFGIIKGILLGIGLSLFLVIQKMSNPNYAVLGRLKDADAFRDKIRFPEAQNVPGVLLIRYDQDLFFGNMDHFYDSMIMEIKRVGQIKKFILHFGAVQSIDGASIERLKELIKYCQSHNIVFQLTNVTGQMRDLLNRYGFYDLLGKNNFHLSIGHALEDDNDAVSSSLSSHYSSQINEDLP